MTSKLELLCRLVEETETVDGKTGIWRTQPSGHRVFYPDDGSAPIGNPHVTRRIPKAGTTIRMPGADPKKRKKREKAVRKVQASLEISIDELEKKIDDPKGSVDRATKVISDNLNSLDDLDEVEDKDKLSGRVGELEKAVKGLTDRLDQKENNDILSALKALSDQIGALGSSLADKKEPEPAAEEPEKKDEPDEKEEKPKDTRSFFTKLFDAADAWLENLESSIRAENEKREAERKAAAEKEESRSARDILDEIIEWDAQFTVGQR